MTGVIDIGVNGLRTRVAVDGDGPPLLLISGIWGGVSAWKPLVEQLTGYRTIAFDAPGIGGTQLPPQPMRLPALARFSAAVLDALELPRAHVLGVSFGGLVAQQLALLAPERIERLVLVSTSSALMHVPGQPAALLRLLTTWTPDNLRDAGDVFGGRIRREPHLLAELDLRVPTSASHRLNRLNGLTGWWGVPWSIRHPTLVLTGDDDPVVPPQNSRILAAFLPNARLHVVRGAGHLFLFDSPAQAAPIIDDFLRQPGARTRPTGLGRLAS